MTMFAITSLSMEVNNSERVAVPLEWDLKQTAIVQVKDYISWSNGFGDVWRISSRVR